MGKVFWVLAATLALSRSAFADLVFELQGSVDSRTGAFAPFPPQVQVGSPVTGMLLFRDNFSLSPDAIPDPTIGYYSVLWPNTSEPYPVMLSVNFAGVRPMQWNVPFAGPFIVEHGATGDRITLFGQADPGGTATLSLTFIDTTGRTLSSDAWTFNFAAPTWDQIVLDAHYSGNPNDPLFWRITASVGVVPESGFGILIPAGLCLIWFRYGRRTRSPAGASST